MDSLVAQIQTLAEQGGDAIRQNVVTALRDLQYRLETPKETLFKIFNTHLQLAVIHIGIDLNLFKELTKDGVGIMTTEDLAQKTGASSDLLDRLLRYLASTGYILNPSASCFQANKLTHFLAHPMADAGIIHAFDTCGPAIQAFPSFLAETNYQDPSDGTNTPFHKGFNTKLSAFEYLKTRTKQLQALQVIMTAMQSSAWIEGFELLDRKVKEEEREKTFFVDVGGGYGHQCVQLLGKYPELKGRVVLQDLKEVVEGLKPIEGVEVRVQDFFAEQSIKGADFYYLRRIFHDWPDSSCAQILKHLTAAMTSESRVLIDEVVLPNVNVNWEAAMADISMAIQFAGRERTKKQWENLVGESGLRIEDIRTYNPTGYNSILVLQRK